MSAWPGKFVIGLTGNIATGKSIVRKMLEHLGAYGIDADSLSHRAIAQGGPAFKPVVDFFGKWILAEDGQIDRAKLGRIAFTDPDMMARLEKIIHPFVRQAVDLLISRSPQRVIVIEAIKLLEGDLKKACDEIWVTTAPEELQVERLIAKRKLTRENALVRIQAQNPQADKIKAADVIITNIGSVEDIWKQVHPYWKKIAPEEESLPIPTKPAVPTGEVRVYRAGPRQAPEMATLITHLTGSKKKVNQGDIMTAFGEKAFMAFSQDGKMVGLVGWQVENLITRVLDFYMEAHLPVKSAIPLVIKSIEEASAQLQSEAALIFLPPALAQLQAIWSELGYRPATSETLAIRAWQEAARESQVPGTVMLFKQLRKDRVLRPI